MSPVSLPSGDPSLGVSGSGGGAAPGGSGATTSSEGISTTSVGASSAASSGGGSLVSEAWEASGEEFRAAAASSNMSYSAGSGGREGAKRDGGLGAVTVSTVNKPGYSSGRSGEAKRGSSSSSVFTSSPASKERKSITTMAAALSEAFDGEGQRSISSNKPALCY